MWWVTTDVAVSVCGRSGLWPFRSVAVSVCGRFGLWPFRFVAVSVCGLSGLWPFRFVAVSVVAVSVCGRYDLLPSILHQALCIISNPSVSWNWSYSPETLNSGQHRRFFVLCDLEIWWITLENKRAPLLYYTKLCASFQIHLWIQIGVTVRKRSIWVKISNLLPRVTLKFDRWPCKTIGHLFYATWSFVQHFVPIGEFKLELQSRNAQSGSNLTIIRAVLPWNLTDDLAKQ